MGGLMVLRRFGKLEFWNVRIFLAMLLLLLILAEPARGETETQARDEADRRITDHEAVDHIIPSHPNDLFVVLKNGLTVLVRESHDSEVVSVQVLVKTGSVYEGERMGGGLSHYLEHVVAGGTTSRFTEARIADRIQALGGAANAYTSYDRTTYFINTTQAHYGDALELLLAYVSDCQFDENEYTREKKVILQEFQMGENDPSNQLWFSFVKTAYREHPVRHPVIGERDVFLAMDREDIVAHYRRWHTPENMIVAVVGNVDKEDVLKTVLAHGGGELKRTANPPYVLPDEPAQLAPRRVEKVLPMARLTEAMMGFRTITLTDPDLYALDVLAVIMGDGRTSQLYQTVRDEKRLALSVSAWSWTPQFAQGQFIISMDLSEDKLQEALDAVWDELEGVKTRLVPKQVLRRAKNKVVADHVFGRESAEDQAGQLAMDWAVAGDPYFSDRYVERIQEVRPEDIRRVAKKYFKKETMTVAVVKPPSGPSQKSVTTSLKRPETDIEKQVLPNGMTLLFKKSEAVPIVTFQFAAKGGARFEPADRPGLCRFMAGLLTKGTTSRSKLDIAEALEDVGGSIGSMSGYNTVNVSASVLKEHFDLALELLADVILNSDFPEDEIEKQREDTLLAIKRQDEDWTTEITRMFRTHYYRKHPYRKDLLGEADAVKGFSREELIGFYRAIIKSNNAVLAVFGDVDYDQVVSKVEKAFSSLRPGVLELPVIEPETRNIEENKTFTVVNDKTSSAILVGYNGLTLDDSDVPAADVLDAIISGIGYPSGWLQEALRGGGKSLVYYVHAYPAFGIDGGYFGIMTQTTPENHDEVLRIILEKVTLIQTEEVNVETLARAKNMCITMHQLDLETIEAQASSAGLNEILGLGYDEDRRYPGSIEKVTAADVLRVAKRLMSHHLITATNPAPVD
jgi:zinc protease